MKTCYMFRRMLRKGEAAPILGVSLGINGENPYIEYGGEGGVDARGPRLYTFQQSSYLIYWPGHFIPDIIEPHPRELTEADLLRRSGASWTMGIGARDTLSTPGLICSWSYYGFVVAVKGNEELANFLTQLYKAFCKGHGHACVREFPQGSGMYTLCLFPQTVTMKSTRISGLLDH